MIPNRKRRSINGRGELRVGFRMRWRLLSFCKANDSPCNRTHTHTYMNYDIFHPLFISSVVLILFHLAFRNIRMDGHESEKGCREHHLYSTWARYSIRVCNSFHYPPLYEQYSASISRHNKPFQNVFSSAISQFGA